MGGAAVGCVAKTVLPSKHLRCWFDYRSSCGEVKRILCWCGLSFFVASLRYRQPAMRGLSPVLLLLQPTRRVVGLVGSCLRTRSVFRNQSVNLLEHFFHA